MMTHFFTPEEANKKLPEIKKLVSTVVNSKKALEHAGGKEKTDALDGLAYAASKLAEIGVELKDPDIGLIDFPAMRFKEPVYLCWKLDEEEVLYWHEVTEGYRGRKLLKPEATQVR